MRSKLDECKSHTKARAFFLSFFLRRRRHGYGQITPPEKTADCSPCFHFPGFLLGTATSNVLEIQKRSCKPGRRGSQVSVEISPGITAPRIMLLGPKMYFFGFLPCCRCTLLRVVIWITQGLSNHFCDTMGSPRLYVGQVFAFICLRIFCQFSLVGFKRIHHYWTSSFFFLGPLPQMEVWEALSVVSAVVISHSPAP